MRRAWVNSSALLLGAALLLVLSAEGAARAQSGRRLPKNTAPAPTATPQPTPAQPKTPAQPSISLTVVSDISMNLYQAVPFPERVQTWVAKRLRDSGALSVMEGERANRSEAIKRAKASKDSFVIFLKVDELIYGPTVSGGSGRLNNITIQYAVFAPVTGKSQSSGVVYLRQRNVLADIAGDTRMPVCYPGVRGNELVLLAASLEVAERVMSALSVPIPPECLPPTRLR